MDNKLVALYTILLLSLVVLLTSVNTISISPRYPAGQPVNNNKNNEEEDDGGGGGEDPHHESDNWEQQELINLRKKILKSLGLTRLPDISKVNRSPEEMEAALQAYHKSVEETERRNRQESESPVQKQSIVYTYNDQGFNPPPGVVPYSGDNLTSSWLYFPTSSLTNLSSSVRTSGSVVATLRLHRCMNMDDASSAAFHLYHVNAYGELELMDSQPASALTQDDIGYLWDVTDIATSWIEMPTLNGGLLLTCTHCDKLASLIELTLTRPQLLVRVTPSVHVRTKRSKQNQNTISDFTPTESMGNCTRNERRCCRKSLKVSMVDLGLEKFILSPLYFDAGYCQGKCPHNHNPASTHANIQSFLSMKKSNKRHKKIPKLCCAPSKLKAIKIKYLDEMGLLTESLWENVVVERCACS